MRLSHLVAPLLALVCASPCLGQPGETDLDPSLIVRAPTHLRLGKGLKVGYRYELASTSGEQDTIREFTAIVGETKDAWEVETTQDLLRQTFRGMPVGRGMVMALVVDKQSHEVLIAKIGIASKVDPANKPLVQFKGLRKLRISALPWQKQKAREKPARVEALKLPSGVEVEAEVYVEQVGGDKISSWFGKRGTDLEGVLLRRTLNQTDFGLSGDPVPGELKLEDKDATGKPVSIKTLRATYSNGTILSTTRNVIARAFDLRLVESRAKESSMVLVSLRTDAKRTLTWK